jgi:hypothetical protein
MTTKQPQSTQVMKFISKEQVYAAYANGVFDEDIIAEDTYDTYEENRLQNPSGLSEWKVKQVLETNKAIELWMLMETDYDVDYTDDIISKWTQLPINLRKKDLNSVSKQRLAPVTPFKAVMNKISAKKAEKTKLARIVKVFTNGDTEVVEAEEQDSDGPRLGKEVCYKGTVIESISEAARQHGVTRNHIRAWCKKGINGWSFK